MTDSRRGSERQIAGTKLAERKVQFEVVEDRNSWVKLGLTKGRRCILLDDKSRLQDQDQLIVGE